MDAKLRQLPNGSFTKSVGKYCREWRRIAMRLETVLGKGWADKQWNPRYVEYARANGMTPEAMLEHDREAWPGGQMCGFILWIGEKWAEFKRLHGLPPREPACYPPYEDMFDSWLKEN